MCGRYTLVTHGAELAEVFDLAEEVSWESQYNIAPSQSVAVIRQGQGGRRMEPLQWGLIPYWAKDASIAAKLINARSETVTEKPSFKKAFHARRCVIPADGFFEWKRVGKRKDPMRFVRPDRKPFGMAGLWESWRSPQGEVMETCTILTTAANAVVAPIHHRMPVILSAAGVDQWLSPPALDASGLLPLLQPAPDDLLEVYAVSAHANSARNNDPQCIEPTEVMELPF